MSARRSKKSTAPKVIQLLEDIDVKELRKMHDLTDKELDTFLTNTKVCTKSDQTMMDLVNDIVKKRKISDPDSIYELKVQILFDNMAQKMCACISAEGKTDYKRVPFCRESIFQNRGLDFSTFSCKDGDAVLNPNKKTKKILRKYNVNAKK